MDEQVFWCVKETDDAGENWYWDWSTVSSDKILAYDAFNKLHDNPVEALGRFDDGLARCVKVTIQEVEE